MAIVPSMMTICFLWTAFMIAPVIIAISNPPYSVRASSYPKWSGVRCAALVSTSSLCFMPASSSPVPRPMSLFSGMSRILCAIHAAAEVLPMPISPNAKASELVDSAISAPVYMACFSCCLDIAGCCEKSAVPDAMGL